MSEKIPMERHNYDVVVIGAGGAGLRAAVEAREAGLRVAIICVCNCFRSHDRILLRVHRRFHLSNLNNRSLFIFLSNSSG